MQPWQSSITYYIPASASLPLFFFNLLSNQLLIEQLIKTFVFSLFPSYLVTFLNFTHTVFEIALEDGNHSVCEKIWAYLLLSLPFLSCLTLFLLNKKLCCTKLAAKLSSCFPTINTVYPRLSGRHWICKHGNTLSVTIW